MLNNSDEQKYLVSQLSETSLDPGEALTQDSCSSIISLMKVDVQISFHSYSPKVTKNYL